VSKDKNDLDDIIDISAEAKVVVKKESVEKTEFKPGIGVDIGTANIVVSKMDKDGNFINRYHRNMLYPLDVSDEAADLLDKSNYLYVKVDNKFFVVGDDALSLVNALGKGEVIRPMAKGLLNPSLKEASELLFYIIKAVVGEPNIPQEPLRFSIPANAVNSDIDNLFHKMVLTNFFKAIGFSPKPVNEAMAVAYDSNPKIKEEDKEIPLSGVALSAGAGMTNLASCFKGLELNSFSIVNSGDYIDEQVSKVTGVAKSKITKRKEKELDLTKHEHSDRVLSALNIYYGEYVSRISHLIAKEFTKLGSEIQGAAEIVVAGGTSMPKGFCKLFEDSLAETELPFKIWRVRAATSPFFAVSNGCCLRALSDYKKVQKK
jgi:actin-like ATPase involved in cell morphogenesis